MDISPTLSAFRPRDRSIATQTGLDLIRRLAHIADGVPTNTAAVDELHFQANFLNASVLPIDELLRLAEDGHASEFRVEQDGWTLSVRADGLSKPSIDTSGPAEDVLAADQIAALELALLNANASDALQIVNQLPVAVSITIRHSIEISGFHWIETNEALCKLLAEDRWAGTLRAITGGPKVLVVGDAGDALLQCRHFVACGPDAECDVPTPAPNPPKRREERRLPSPVLFAEPATEATSLQPLVNLLQGVTRIATWFHLATDAHLDSDGSAELHFDGARSVELRARPAHLGGDASLDVALYEWATSSADPAMADAVAHAASLAITSSADLGTAAAPVLRTARTLYDLSRQGAIAEALATRRSARHAALDASRSAASTARAVASKAVERSLIQAAAAIAVVLTNAARLIGWVPALLPIGLIVLLSVISLIVATRVEIPNAERAMKAELDDLESYREALSADDLTQIRGLKVVYEGETELRSARRVAKAVYIATLIAVLVVGVLLVTVHFDAPTAAPTPSPAVPSPSGP